MAETPDAARPHGVAEGVLARARNGDDAAFAELWRTHQAPLVRYLRTKRILAPEEVASEVWLDVARSIDGFEGDEQGFRGWLFTIAHRRGVDAIRSRVRHLHVVHEDVDDVAASSPAAEDDYLAESAIDRAIAVVRQLPPDMADVVMLRIVNDLPVATVAEITGQSEANVRVLAHRGLKKLAELVTIPSP